MLWIGSVNALNRERGDMSNSSHQPPHSKNVFYLLISFKQYYKQSTSSLTHGLMWLIKKLATIDEIYQCLIFWLFVWTWQGTRLVVSVMVTNLIARFMGPTWGPSGAYRPQVGPMLAPWTLLSEKAVCPITHKTKQGIVQAKDIHV